jgi:hypothetical protein
MNICPACGSTSVGFWDFSALQSLFICGECATLLTGGAITDSPGLRIVTEEHHMAMRASDAESEIRAKAEQLRMWKELKERFGDRLPGLNDPDFMSTLCRLMSEA